MAPKTERSSEIILELDHKTTATMPTPQPKGDASVLGTGSTGRVALKATFYKVRWVKGRGSSPNLSSKLSYFIFSIFRSARPNRKIIKAENSFWMADMLRLR